MIANVMHGWGNRGRRGLLFVTGAGAWRRDGALIVSSTISFQRPPAKSVVAASRSCISASNRYRDVRYHICTLCYTCVWERLFLHGASVCVHMSMQMGKGDMPHPVLLKCAIQRTEYHSAELRTGGSSPTCSPFFMPQTCLPF